MMDPTMFSEEQPLPLFWGTVAKYGLGIAVMIFYFTVVMHFQYTPDDTYIYLQYAKNLAHGNGFTFNVGMPTYGVTGPLWVLLIAAGAAAGLDPFMVAKTFDIVFASLSIVLLQILSFAVIRDRLYAFFVAWVFSFDAWFLRWSSSGMETSLAILLALATVWYVFHREYYLAAFACALLTLVRPEGFLLFLVLQIDNYLDVRRNGVSLRYVLLPAAVFAALILPWLIYSYSYFGTLVPNTLAAKSGHHFDLRELWNSTVGIAKIIGGTQLMSFTLMVVCLGVVLSKAGIQSLWEVAFPVVWVLLLLVGYIVQDVQVVSRYLLPITPFIILYAFWGLKKVEEGWNIPLPRMRALLFAVAAFSLVQNTFVYRTEIVPHVVSFSAGMNQCLRPIAYWLRTNSPQDGSVVAPDVGLLGYVSEKTIYDPAGLITPNVRKAFDSVTYDEGMIGRRYARVVHPDFVVDRSSTKERLSSDSLLPIMTAEFPGLGISNPGTVFYTLYKAVK